MRLPEIALRNRPFTLVVAVLLTALGALSFLTMPRMEDPSIDAPFATVAVVFPGADPEVIESLAVDPLEESIREADDLKHIETTIEDGLAVLSVEFLSEVSQDDSCDRVVEKVNAVRAELPPEVRSVEVSRAGVGSVAILQFALVADSFDAAVMGDLAERLETRLERVPGVREVDTWAWPERQVHVRLQPDRMHALGVTLDRVERALAGAGLDIPGGTVDAGLRRFNVRTSGDFDSLDQIRRTALPGPDGAIVRVEDVADVVPGFADESHRARFDGRPAALLSVVQRDGASIFRVTEAAQAVVDEVRPTLPAGIEIHTLFDQSESVDARVGGFFSSLYQGVFLVGLVMLLFLGLRPALLVVVSIPLAILLAVSLLDLSGYAIQQMSIVGLVIALGLLVDDAIIVVESIGRRLAAGDPVRRAAIAGASEVGWPSVSGTVTTVLAFLPMALIPSSTGDYIRSLPVTVVFALLASLALSLTLVPVLAAHLSKRSPAGRTAPSQGVLDAVAEGAYARLLAACLRRPGRTLLFAGAAFVASLALFPIVGVSLFPKAEKPQLLIDIETAEGASLDATDDAARWVESVVAPRSDVRRYAASVGRDGPQVYYNITPRREKANVAQVFVEFTSYAALQGAVPELRAAFAAMPGARISVREFENGPPVEAPVTFKVLGPEIETLRSLAERVEDGLREQPGADDIYNPLSQPRTDLQVVIDRDKAALHGLDLATIDRTVRAGIAGLTVSSFRTPDGDRRPVVVRLPLAGGRPTPGQLSDIDVGGTGGLVPLSQVATLRLVPTRKRIDHYDTERVATVTAQVTGDASALDITRAVAARLEAQEWPHGYRWFAGGTFEEQQEGFAGMLRALLIAILGIFAVLVLQFRSVAQPLIIFASVPLAVVGAILALFITGNTFSFSAFIGMTSLIGIVINNSIILVDYANRRRAEGDSVEEALRAAGRTRFAPIVLTTLTTVGGLLPLTLSGSTLWSPLGWVIIGGLLTSAVLTLVVVPVLYRVVQRWLPATDGAPTRVTPALNEAPA